MNIFILKNIIIYSSIVKTGFKYIGNNYYIIDTYIILFDS